MIETGKKGNYLISAVLIAVFFIVMRPALAYLLYRRAGDYMSAFIVPDAARTYKKALIFNENDVDSRNWLAYCYSLMGRTEEAVAEYKKAIEIDPDDVVALFDLGMIYRRQGRVGEAKELFAKAVAAPQSPNVSRENHHFYARTAAGMLDLLNKPPANEIK